MKNRRFISLVILSIGAVMAAGATGVAAKESVKNRSNVSFEYTASPSDSTPVENTEASTEAATEEKTKKKKQKKTETTTQISPVLPSQPVVDSAELSAITAEYSKTLQEKVELQEKLNLLMDKQNGFISKLHEIDDMIIEYQDKIEDIQDKTAKVQNTLVVLQEDIERAQEEQDAQYDQLKEHIKEEYENGTYTYLDALMDSVDYIDVVNKTEYIQAVDSYNNNILGQLSDSKRRLEDKKAMLQMLDNGLSVLQTAYIEKQDALELLSQQKEEQINMFQKNIDAAKGEMAAIEAIEAEQTAKIAQIEAKYNLSFTVDGLYTGLVYDGADFLWPMPTSTRISSYYGPRVAPTAGATTYHRGIDIDCGMGSAVIAAAAGTVIYTGYLGNAGNAVIVDHGSGISTCYFHLSAFACKVGDSVSAGQVICFSGNTGVSTGPHLHFAVRENGEYVNPLKYYKNVKDNSKVANTEGGSQD